ncbi:MAG: glycosyltransferase family 2 protein [Methylococcales bacterium]|nr:glycosyltransferase family 2 protein [Methylococcales bacterium]
MSLVSIIVPTFNRCHFLRRALHSITRQTYVDIEVIVIDDGSTDKTGEMIAEEFSNIIYIFQSNAGVSSARNKALEYAKGEWIAFLDSDDEWLPNKLDNQINLLKSNPDYKICHTEEQWVRNGVKVNQMKKHKKVGGWIFSECLPLCAMSPSSIMIHHSVFTDVGVFDPELPACEDYDLWLRITSKYPVLLIDEPQIIKYGGHEDQLSQKYWGMDRYRIIALQKIILSDSLSDENRQKATSMLLKKCKIFRQGALKRDKQEVALHYQNIMDQFDRDNVQ